MIKLLILIFMFLLSTPLAKADSFITLSFTQTFLLPYFKFVVFLEAFLIFLGVLYINIYVTRSVSRLNAKELISLFLICLGISLVVNGISSLIGYFIPITHSKEGIKIVNDEDWWFFSSLIISIYVEWLALKVILKKRLFGYILEDNSLILSSVSNFASYMAILYPAFIKLLSPYEKPHFLVVIPPILAISLFSTLIEWKLYKKIAKTQNLIIFLSNLIGISLGITMLIIVKGFDIFDIFGMFEPLIILLFVSSIYSLIKYHIYSETGVLEAIPFKRKIIFLFILALGSLLVLITLITLFEFILFKLH